MPPGTRSAGATKRFRIGLGRRTSRRDGGTPRSATTRRPRRRRPTPPRSPSDRRIRAAARAAQAGVLEQQPDRHEQHDARDHPAAAGHREGRQPRTRAATVDPAVKRNRPIASHCSAGGGRTLHRTAAVNAGVSRSTSRPVPSSVTNSAATAALLDRQRVAVLRPEHVQRRRPCVGKHAPLRDDAHRAQPVGHGTAGTRVEGVRHPGAVARAPVPSSVTNRS